MSFKYTNYTISPDLDPFDIYKKADRVLGQTRPEYREWLNTFNPKINIDEDQEPIYRGLVFALCPSIFEAPMPTQIRRVEDLLVEYLDAQLGFTHSEGVRSATLINLKGLEIGNYEDLDKARITIQLTNLWDGCISKPPSSGANAKSGIFLWQKTGTIS